jgi:hypothetical protein
MKTGLGVQSFPDWVSSVLRITHLTEKITTRLHVSLDKMILGLAP